MEGTGLDNQFVSTRYGSLRVAHFVLCIICLIADEVSQCYRYRMIDWVSSYGLIFTILVLVMFCVRFNRISVLSTPCHGAAKLGSILTGIFGIITSVAFGAAARLSYDWFATGSPATTI